MTRESRLMLRGAAWALGVVFVAFVAWLALMTVVVIAARTLGIPQ